MVTRAVLQDDPKNLTCSHHFPAKFVWQMRKYRINTGENLWLKATRGRSIKDMQLPSICNLNIPRSGHTTWAFDTLPSPGSRAFDFKVEI